MDASNDDKKISTGLEDLHVTDFNGVKVYHCTPSKSDMEWGFSEKKSKAKQLKKNHEYQSRLTIIHDFVFPSCATRVKVSPDGQYVVATGTYKPVIKLYDLEQMSLKVQRNMDEEAIQLQFLSDDASKFMVSRLDRTLEFHAANGLHTTVRVPRYIRDFTYHKATCDVLVASNANEIYRLNLEQGAYQPSILTGFNEANGGITALGLNPVYPILGVAGANGVESWDLRDRSSAGYLDILNTLSSSQMNSTTSLIGSSGNNNNSIASLLRTIQNSKAPLECTALRYNDDTGMELSVGLSTGHVVSYDLRSPKPLAVYDHRYGLPVHSIKYHTNSRTLITSDKKTIRLWDYTQTDAEKRHLTTINSIAPINDCTLVQDSGMLLTACDHPNMQIYFVPRLGTVPNWAASLEAFTEELDLHHQRSIQKQHHLLASGYSEANNATLDMNDVSQTVFDGYKFITREELDKIGFSHLTQQSNMLKPYMHGYLLTNRLHEQLYEMIALNKLHEGATEQDIADTASKIQHGVAQTELDHIHQQISKKIAQQRDAGFQTDDLPTVNKEYAQTILQRDEKLSKRAKKDKSGGAAAAEEVSLLQDDRFSSLFKDEAFAIDTRSDDYKRLHPTLKASLGGGVKDNKKEEEEKKKKRKVHEDDESDNEDIDMTSALKRKTLAPEPAAKKDPKAKAKLDEAQLALQAKQREKHQKQKQFNSFQQTIAGISKSSATNQSKLSSSSSSMLGGVKSSNNNLASVKKGIGVIDVLNNGSRVGGGSAMKMLSLADRIKLEEKQKIQRDEAYAEQQIQLKRQQRQQEGQEQAQSQQGRRKVNKNQY